MKFTTWRKAGLLLGALLLAAPPVWGQNVINTVAGVSWVFPASGPALAAPLGGPQAVATDAAGNIFIADTSNQLVLKATPGGTLTIVAGIGTWGFSGDGGPATLAALYNPFDVAVDASGNLYIADGANCRVRKVTAGGIISTLAGSGACGYSGDGGPATQATLSTALWGISVDSSGNVYIADANNNRVRVVSPSGTITTLAGNGTGGYAGDGGAATAAQLWAPVRAVVDASGKVYIADYNNCVVRRVSGGVITTVAGNGNCAYGGDGGPATGAMLSDVWGLTLDANGNIFVADGSNARIRKINTSGIISTVAGNGNPGFSGDGGQAINAMLSYPQSPAVDNLGNLYIADIENLRIRKVDGSGIITTFAGTGVFKFSGDGGPATAAQMNMPTAIAFDAAGNMYVTDRNNQRVRKVSAAGTVTTVAGNGMAGFSGDGGPATLASLYVPNGLVVDAAGNLLIADYSNCRIRKVDSAGIITTVAGGGSCTFYGDGLQATQARFNGPAGLAFDAAGDLYVADITNNRVRKIDKSGIVTTFAGNGLGIFAGDGGPAASASLRNPYYIAFDAAGNLYISDQNNQRVRKVNTAGIISTIAGNGLAAFSSDGGLATDASLLTPRGIAVDTDGSVYFSELNANRIRKVSSGGIISTFAGTGTQGFGGDGGPATSALLNYPMGITWNAGSLYFADIYNDRVRKISASGGSVSVGSAQAAPGATVTLPVTLALRSGVSVDGLSFSIVITPVAPAVPLTVPLVFQPDAALPAPTLADTSVVGTASVSWLNLATPLSGNVTLGQVTLTLPPGAAYNEVYTVQVAGAAGNLGNSAIALSLVSGKVTINANPVPSITQLSPAAASPGGSAFTLTVDGSGFAPDSVVQWNGTPRSTTFVNPTRLTAAISASDIASAAIAVVNVVNPSPGGGSSAPRQFPIGTSDGNVTASSAPGAVGRVAKIPITLRLNSGISVDTLSFGLQITPAGSAPALSGSLSFTKDAALPDPSLVDTAAGPGFISVGWTALPAALTGTAGLGIVSVTIPSSAVLGQIYIVQVTGASASLSGTNAVALVPGPYASIVIVNQYTVGDTYPLTSDNATQFGDDTLNTLDLIYALRAITNIPGFRPLACTDRFDAMDSYPKDTDTARGGDGLLNNLDLIITLRRVTNIDTSRPVRNSRGLCIASAPKYDTALAPSQPLWRADPNGGGATPVYLESPVDVQLLGLSWSVGTQQPGALRFTPGELGSPTLIDDGIPGALAVSWLTPLSLQAGRPVLAGYVDVREMRSGSVLHLYGINATAANGSNVLIKATSHRVTDR